MGKEGVLKSLPNFLFLVLISLLLIFLENFGWTKSLHALSEQATGPVKRTFYRTRQQINSTVYFLTFWRTGSQKIKNLEERNRELLVEAQKVAALSEENKSLRLQLGAPLSSDWKLLPAQTLGRARYLTIDQGSQAGVRTGQTVIFKNVLVGRVVSVGSYESQVELPTDPESTIPVRTAKTGAQGLLVGQFGKGMNLEKVTQGEVLEKDDTLVTTGEKDYPKGLVIGKVGWVEKNESELFQTAGIEPVLNFDDLQLVFLVKS